LSLSLHSTSGCQTPYLRRRAAAAHLGELLIGELHAAPVPRLHKFGSMCEIGLPLAGQVRTRSFVICTSIAQRAGMPGLVQGIHDLNLDI
jgi:hypothetical protein